MQRRLLIVEDNSMSRKTLCAILDEEYEILEAKNGLEAIDILEREFSTLSAIILDLEMPQLNGFEVMAIIQKNPDMAQIPIIITTATDDSMIEEKALESSAIDYITKPYNPKILSNRIKNTIKLREQAASINATRIDALTGLYSRAAFFELVSSMVSDKEAGFYTMECYDIDHFKVINDQYGNPKGDAILKQVAIILKREFEKAGAIVARIMADHFAILYPVSFADTKEIEKIREKASVLDGSILPISFSIGRYYIDDISIEPSVMYDRAVMEKESIKGRYDVHVGTYDENMRTKLLQEQKIISEMKQAILNRQFELWYQPQVNHETGSLVGAEALVRWRHPVEGIMNPALFIPIFERNGFIYEMDKYVWEQACIFIKERIDGNKKCIPISVNISRYDLYHEDLVDYIVKLVHSYQIPTELIRLEVIESAFEQSSERVVRVVKEFRNAGFVVEIDDFGSGYSSLNILKDVPANIVKLDMRFLEDNNNSNRGGNILESIVRMTRWLGISVIAEGVEELSQADFLKSIGCNYIQGYLYSKPLMKEDFEQVIEKNSYVEKMATFEKVMTYDRQTFWDPKSLDTLIFNSYVGGACVFEYCEGKIDIIRVNQEYTKVLFGEKKDNNDAIRLNWYSYMTPETKAKVSSIIKKAMDTKEQIADELILSGLREPGKNIYLYARIRMIASTGNRYLFYSCLVDVTSQRETQIHEAQMKEQMEIILRDMYSAVSVYFFQEDGSKKLLYANDLFYLQRGYSKTEYEEELQTPFDIVYPDDVMELKEKNNSIKENGATKECNTSKKLKGLQFIIKDNGIGMSEEFIPHAFDRFQQEYRKDVKEKVEGTGLGLPIVKELVKLMKGTITLESKLNEGSTFTVELPFEAMEVLEQEQTKEQCDYSILKGKRILIVEDFELNFEIVQKLLEKYGCDIEWVANGQLACEKFESSALDYYQIILMDIRMPVLGGLDATRTIRSMNREDAKSIPIIAMSADAFSEDEKTAYSAGMNAQVTKPIIPKKLYQTCCDFLKAGN